MIPVILSGGSGTRLWPVSRDSYPKQFCEFFDHSFLHQTISRLKPLGATHIVTLDSMASLTKRAAHEAGLPDNAVILEPLPKSTAAAIALMTHIFTQQGRGNEVVGVFPADHIVTDEAKFLSACRVAEDCAQQDYVVSIGIQPRYPATGYGYIEMTGPVSGGDLRGYPVKRFHEKPELKNAQMYVQQTGFYWNAGIFVFKISLMAQLLREHLPEMWRKISTIRSDLTNIKSVYANLVAQSIDYGVMEKESRRLYCVPGDFGWSDVGSWDELARLEEEHIKIDSKAKVYAHRAHGNFVYSTQPKVIGLSGVEQLVVVHTPDALLVARKGSTEEVKNLVQIMREDRAPQTKEHTFEIRPWGGFEVLSDQQNHKVKRITVDVGAQLSYQLHRQREEHWVVISGEAEIFLEDKTIHLQNGEQYRAARGLKHRIRNAGSTPLVIVEVQTGHYFGEDDIERFADDYGRVK